MRELPDQQPEHTGSEDALLAVEVLAPDAPRPGTHGGVTLRAEAARDLRDTLGGALVKSAKAGRRAAETTYRLVPSQQASQGLADGTLRWATASSGDAAVLIKETATGRIAGHGQLQRVKPSPAKLLGPAAWEAMAMATQQHYLVEINDKLQSIEKGVDEALSRMDDDKRGTLRQVRGTFRCHRAQLR
jgi:hypothetical protein